MRSVDAPHALPPHRTPRPGRGRSRPAGAALLAAILLGLPACGGSEPPVPDVSAEVDAYTFAVSHMLFRVAEGKPFSHALVRARQAERLLREGQPFAEVARSRSEDESAPDGGFLGFVPTHHDTSFAGAVQALRPGQTSGIVRTSLGLHIIHRHTFAEGVRLERALRLPAYGFWLAHGEMEGAGGRTREQALEEARTLVRRLRAGEITIQEARMSARGARGPDRPDAFLGGFANRPGREDVFAALSSVPEEGFPDPVDTDGGVAVLQRGRHMRMLVRHILVRHAHGDNEGRIVTRTRAEARARAEEALGEARADPGRWQNLVERYSDDTLTVPDQGTWGVLSPGETPLPIELAAHRTPPASLCPEVVESPLGFHVLLRVN